MSRTMYFLKMAGRVLVESAKAHFPAAVKGFVVSVITSAVIVGATLMLSV